eukprot:g2628.t1
MGQVASGESTWSEAFGCCGDTRNRQGGGRQGADRTTLADRFRNAASGNGADGGAPDEDAASKALQEKYIKGGRGGNGGSRRGGGGGGGGVTVSAVTDPADDPQSVETWFFKELQADSQPPRADPSLEDHSDDDSDAYDLEGEEGGQPLKRFLRGSSREKEKSLMVLLKAGSNYEDVVAAKNLLRKLVKQAGLIKDRRIRNIWQGRGKLALAQAYMHENKYRTAERRYIRAAKHFFVCNSQRECMAHVCLWELYMDQPKRGTRDYSKAVVAAKRMLELMGPDQKEDRDRIEDMIMSAQKKLRQQAKSSVKKASARRSQPFEAGALDFGRLNNGTGASGAEVRLDRKDNGGEVKSSGGSGGGGGLGSSTKLKAASKAADKWRLGGNVTNEGAGANVPKMAKLDFSSLKKN